MQPKTIVTGTACLCALAIVCTACALAFKDGVALTGFHWSTANVLAGIAAITAVVVPLFGLLTLVVTKWTDLLGTVKAQQTAQQAHAVASDAKETAQTAQQAASQTMVKVNGEMDVRMANAFTAGLKEYLSTNDIGKAYNAVAVASKVSQGNTGGTTNAPGAVPSGTVPAASGSGASAGQAVPSA